MLEDLPLHGDQDGLQAPPKVYSYTMETIDLEDELVNQYSLAKTMLAAVENDTFTPVNQKAQLLNSVTAILVQLAKSQTDLYNMNRLKAMEEALIRSLKALPEESQKKFYVEWEENLAAIR